MRSRSLYHAIVTALLLAVGLVLPFFTAQLPVVGNALLPLHLPALLCGFLCGPWYGGALGATLPLLRSVLFGAPSLYPRAVAMSFELAAYAITAGLCYRLFRKKNTVTLLASLLIAMIAGRLVWGAVQAVLLGVAGKPFTLAFFWTEAIVNALPGIVLQWILIPVLVPLLEKTGKFART